MNKQNGKFPIKAIIIKIVAVLVAVGVWELVSASVGMEMLLASPFRVILRLTTIWQEDGFFSTVLYSLLKITAGFGTAFFIGTLLAIISSSFSFIEGLLVPYVVTIKTVPLASFIILCLIWFSFDKLTVFIAFLIAFPVIYSNVLQGIKSADAKLAEMAKLYHVTWGRRLLYIYIPSFKPYLISACGVSVGMAWKAGVAAEVIGMVSGSIGERLYDAKIYFQNADLLAWTVIIVALSILMEKLVVLLLKLAFNLIEKL